MKKTSRLLLIFVFTAAVILLPLYFGCPLYSIFGITCPGCGTTRAWLSLFRGDVNGALAWNHFFWLIPVYLAAAIYAGCFDIKKHAKIIRIFLIVSTIVLVGYNVLRWMNVVIMPE